MTWASTDGRLGAIALFYGAAPKPREAIRRLCPAVGSWPGKDFTTRAAGVLEADLTAAGIPHDLKVYPGAKHSFFNDQWRNYHAAAADSWQRVLAFFAEHVRGSPGSSRLTGGGGANWMLSAPVGGRTRPPKGARVAVTASAVVPPGTASWLPIQSAPGVSPSS